MHTQEKQSRSAEWRAFNGHMMVGFEERFRKADGSWGEWRTVGWNAGHAEDCHCWTSDEGFTGMDDW